jgi:hypothetical protein
VELAEADALVTDDPFTDVDDSVAVPSVSVSTFRELAPS